jgi:hypothetical protein
MNGRMRDPLLPKYVTEIMDERDALRARVAKLEAALEDVLKFSNDPGVIRFVRAALKDAPQ